MSFFDPLRDTISRYFHGFNWQMLMSDISHTISPERIGPYVTQRVFWRAQTREKIIALSFDDGPNPRFTPELLDILKKFSVSATFFLIGRYVEKAPEIAQQIVAGGHEVGNHTFSHKMLPFLEDHEIREEISTTHRILAKVTGRVPSLLRPPMGMFSKRTVSIAEEWGYRTVIGDVYPRDPHMPGTSRIIRRVLKRSRPGSLIILHDGGNTRHFDRSQTLRSVEAIIPKLKNAGYRFVTLPELIMADGVACTPAPVR